MTHARVLVVDDESSLRSLLSTICTRLGYTCDTAADGAEALDKLRQHQYDAMLLDLMMPRLNGFEVIEALPSVTPQPSVIVLTAAGGKAAASLIEHESVHAVLQKPFDMSQLAQALAEAVGRGAER